MRKKLFLASLVIILLNLILFSTLTVYAANLNCGGLVQDSQGIPLEGVSVSIYVTDFNTPNASSTTNDQGIWVYTNSKWPNQWGDINRIEFQKNGYLPHTWNPSRGVPYDCQTGTIQMASVGGEGWSCVKRSGVTADEKCIQKKGGQYSDLNTCAQNCRLFKCYGAACVPCRVSESPTDCPYLEPTCNNECRIGITPTPTSIDIQGNCDLGEVNTALGCIPIGDPQAFVAWLLGWAIGIAGGIAFLLMIVASFQIITATGNPEKLQAGKELLGSALTGLLFIIFSIYLLRLIGVSILQIPGFN